MTPGTGAPDTGVGPVLEAGPTAQAVVTALRQLNPRLDVIDRGAYWRVQAPGRCRLTRRAVEAQLGRAFRLPGDLEALMPSFAGRFSVDAEEASWEAR